MRILVCAKHVPDTTEVRFDTATRQLRIGQAPTKINNYDEHALEAAARIRESEASEVVVACVGPAEAAKTMKAAVAVGADRAVVITGPWSATVDPAGTVLLLAGAARRHGPFDLILCGDVSEDGYHSLVPGMLAAALGLPFLRGVSALDTRAGSAIVSRLADDFVETYDVRLPAVLSVSSSLNKVRTVTTLQVMKVAMSRVTMLSAVDVGVSEEDLSEGASATRVVAMRPAAQPRRREVVTGDPEAVASAVVDRLRGAGVLR